MIYLVALLIGFGLGCVLTPKELGFALDEEAFKSRS